MAKVERVLAIDPGVHYFGYAFAVGGQIYRCGYLSPLEEAQALQSLGAEVCIIEKPTQYPGAKVDRKDITDLSIAAGILLAYVNAPQSLLWEPRQWKGQVPKPIHQRRILAAMTAMEKITLPRSAKERGHILDACGIALKYLGRLDGRVDAAAKIEAS